MYIYIRYPDEPLRQNYSRLVPDSLSNYRYYIYIYIYIYIHIYIYIYLCV